jgi:hypothetical protein
MKTILNRTLDKGLLALLVAFTIMSVGSAAFAISKKDLRRADERGSVEVVVLYLNPLQQEKKQELFFEITLDTHSANLSQYDMGKISFLRIDGGPEINASEWVKPGGGGHHISGTLIFNSPDTSAEKVLELVIKTVGGVEERVFQWKLPLE